MIASIIIIVLYSLSLGMCIARHGKEKEGTYSFWVDFASAMFMLFLMYLAGTFDKLLGL